MLLRPGPIPTGASWAFELKYDGYVLPEIETVVEQHEEFAVVDKSEGIPEQIAKQTDPRG